MQYPAFVCASAPRPPGRAGVKEPPSAGGAALQLRSLWALGFGAEGLSPSLARRCYCSCLSHTSHRAGPWGTYSPAKAPALPDDNNPSRGPTASSELRRAARPGRDLPAGGGFARTKTSRRCRFPGRSWCSAVPAPRCLPGRRLSPWLPPLNPYGTGLPVSSVGSCRGSVAVSCPQKSSGTALGQLSPGSSSGWGRAGCS